MLPVSVPNPCFGCGACAAACPTGAIALDSDAEGFPYPVVDTERCVGCGRCDDVCPATHELPRAHARCYAVRCANGELLRASSSGGAFSLLAHAVLDAGGLVCGACLDDSLAVTHRLSTDIAPMRKSKYVQSTVVDCLEPIRAALDAGTDVLFSGTPCQCHAAMRYTSASRGRLITVALICRGVASPGLWADYVAWLQRDGTLTAYDFRDKGFDDDGRHVSLTIDGTTTHRPHAEDRFQRLYARCLDLRPSCYQCPYCSPTNDFDFTIGDFWGVAATMPELADGRGVSLVIAHSAMARQILEGLASTETVIPCEGGIALQPSLREPAREPLLRRFLFADYARKVDGARCDIDLILRKYAAG